MWLAATVIVDAVRAEPLADALMAAGALSVDISDAEAGTERERPIFDEPGGAPAPQWRHARVSALFGGDADVAAAMVEAFKAASVRPDTGYEVTRVEDEDWVRRTQSQFKPQKISERLWIVPTWHAPPDENAINIALDPGLAFGTGAHPTTRLCLRWLERNIAGRESLIDFGCGSGILAIAAMKLGAARAAGVDIDPQAVEAAQANARQNDVAIAFGTTLEASVGAVDIVVANILARPLIVLAPLLAGLARPGGRLALSGILAEQTEDVSAAYRAWYDFETPWQEDGWVLLSARRNSLPT